MYKYVWYENKFFVIPEWHYEEFMSIPRTRVAPTQNPYKFSVAMISLFRRRSYVTLTNYEFEYDVGFKRDWIALVEAIDQGIKFFEEEMRRREQVAKASGKPVIILL